MFSSSFSHSVLEKMRPRHFWRQEFTHSCSVEPLKITSNQDVTFLPWIISLSRIAIPIRAKGVACSSFLVISRSLEKTTITRRKSTSCGFWRTSGRLLLWLVWTKSLQCLLALNLDLMALLEEHNYGKIPAAKAYELGTDVWGPS